MTTFFDTPFLKMLRELPGQQLVFNSGNENTVAGEVYAKSITLATGLKEKGFRENDRAVIIVPPGEDFLHIFFAANALKGMLAIIDPEMGRDNFEAKLKQFAPKWIFIDSRLLLLKEHPFIRFLYLKFSRNPVYFSIPDQCNVIATGKKYPLFGNYSWLRDLQKRRDVNANFIDAGDHELLVTYTSGTLAEPKGVVHSVNSLYESLLQIKNVLNVNDHSRIGAYLPHFLLIGICTGAPVFIYDKKKTASWKFGLIEKNKLTILFGPPSDYLPLIELCMNEKRKLPASIELIILGSAPVHPNFLKALYEVVPENCRVVCLYGMTENLVVASSDGRLKMNSDEKGDVVGPIRNDVQVEVADDGEILIYSPQLFSRYLHLEKRETPHRTGDLGFISSEGILVLTGRKKDMIIRRDTNIYPAVFEKTIKNIPGIDEAALIGIYSKEKHDEEVVLVAEGEELNESDLYSKLEKGDFSIDKEALPDRIVLMKIPRSGRQDKIDRKKLREILSA